MKKGLLSILALAVTIVGCQNYDDQFDALNTQITALKSQVDGLAAVQSAVTALQGQLASLSSAALTSADLDAALSSGLADIISDVEAVQAAVADVASSADVTAVNEALEDAQADLDELLAQGAVFTGDVVVNSVSTLDAFHSMGGGLAIVNGKVDITVSTAMDQAKVQELVDNILTVIKDFKYTSNSSDIAETVFTNLSGTQTLTVKQGGGYQFPALASATKIILDDAYKSTVTQVSFPALTSVTSFGVDTADTHSISFNKATLIDINSLASYSGSSLTLSMREDTTSELRMDAFRDVDSDGDATGIALTIEGPNSLSISNLDGEDGSITLSKVDTATVNSYDGTININAGVVNFTADNVVAFGGSMNDIENITMTGVKDPNLATDKEGPTVAISSKGDLETVTLHGTFNGVSLTSNGNLTTVTIDADVTGAIDLSSNSDLETVTLTGSKATGVTVGSNDSLVNLTIDSTMRADVASGSKKDGSVKVTDNTDLEDLTISSTDLDTLYITGNSDLESITASGITTLGASAKPDVKIYGNNFTASKAEDKTNTASTLTGDGKANDLGKFSTSSGFDTLKDYLVKVAADTDSKAKVYFDTIESVVNEAGTETATDQTYSSTTTRDDTTADDDQRVLVLTPNTADLGKSATTAKRSFVITSGSTIGIWANNTAVKSSAAISSNNAVAIATEILTTANLASATAAGVTMTATDGGNPVALVDIGPNTSAVENSATAASSAFSFTVSDTFSISVEGFSATVTGTAYTGTDAFANAWVTAWNNKYSTAAMQRYTVSTSANSEYVRIKLTAKDRGTGSLGKAISVSFSAGKNATDSSVGYIVGNDASMTKSSADNSTKGDDIVLTLAATTAGSILSQVGYFGKTQANAAKNVSITDGTFEELSTTYSANATASNTTLATNLYPHESRRNDVILPEEPIAAAASNATSYTRVHWL